MTTQTKEDSTTLAVDCSAKDIETYLQRHPEFFAENPQLLTELEVPHPSGKAVSLIERQVALLRQDNKQLKDRIKELVSIAKENENLVAKLHKLSVTLIESQSAQQFIDTLQARLKADFSAFDVSVKLYENQFTHAVETNTFIKRDDDNLRNFEKYLNSSNPVCGRFTPEQLNYLFADNSTEIKSVAFVPLVAGEDLGFFAIASDNPERFKAGMGTAFLSSLSDLAAAVLTRFKAG